MVFRHTGPVFSSDTHGRRKEIGGWRRPQNPSWRRSFIVSLNPPYERVRTRRSDGIYTNAWHVMQGGKQALYTPALGWGIRMVAPQAGSCRGGGDFFETRARQIGRSARQARLCGPGEDRAGLLSALAEATPQRGQYHARVVSPRRPVQPITPIPKPQKSIRLVVALPRCDRIMGMGHCFGIPAASVTI